MSEIGSGAYGDVHRAGMRLTRLKRAIIAIFEAGGCGLCAADISRKLGERWHISSVHRSLDSLREAGILTRVRSSDGVIRYRCAPDRYPDHGHLKCSSCGDIVHVDFDPPESFFVELEKRTGIRISRLDLMLEGLCSSCAGCGN
jgi:Fe2+ or Zn2+ uptake regulation protein